MRRPLHHLLFHIQVLMLLGCGGCRKAPNDPDFQERHLAAILGYYSTTNAVEAESVMLKFERFAQKRDAHGAEGVDFDKALGAVYHRLWAVQLQLGKNAEAETNYHRSYELYERYYKKHGMNMTGAELSNQVEAVGINFGEPNWRTNFGKATGKSGAQK